MPVFQGYATPITDNQDTLYKIKYDFVKDDQTVNNYIFSFYYKKGVPLPAETGVPDILIFQEQTYTTTDFNGVDNSQNIAATATYYQILDSDNNAENVAYPDDIVRIWIRFNILGPNGSINLKLVNQNTKTIFLDGSEPPEETKFNPKGKNWNFYIFGAQLEEDNNTASKSLSFYNKPVLKQERVTVYERSAFEYFVYTLYGIPGEFRNIRSNIYLDYVAYDTKIRELRRLSCGDIKCFESEFEAFASKRVTRDVIYTYKGTYYGNSSLYGFFYREIYNKLFNIENEEYLKIYTNFDKLYISKGSDQISIYDKNDDRYIYQIPNNTNPFNAVNEIIDLLIKYKNFTYKNVTLDKSTYKVPESYGVKLTPIPKNKLDTILFSGFLNKNLDLNIQAGFCRYYLPSNDVKDFGYFYETTNFYDVNNAKLIDVQDSNASFTKLFPDEKELINDRPKKNISSTLNVQFSRLVKNNNPIEVEKTINFTAYVQSCYFKKEIPNVALDLTGTFYNIKKNMSEVWTIKIKNSLDDKNPSYTSSTLVGIDVDTYEAKSFANINSADIQTRYLEVTHNDMEEIPLNEDDKAVITLKSYLSENDPTPVISTFSIP